MLKLKCNLRHIMKEKNVTQKELEARTGIRQAGISELINLKRRAINLEHLETIMNELNIKDASRLFEIVECED
jgi:putative transcriptional regulator